MKFISHRGNLAGRKPALENNPTYVDLAIKKRYDVEVDVWKIENKLYLGHDSPMWEVPYEYFYGRFNSLWCHAKNIGALHALSMMFDVNCFWHQNDDYTLTSKGYIWTYPKNKVLTTNRQISLIFDIENIEGINLGGGICSDYIEHYKNILK